MFVEGGWNPAVVLISRDDVGCRRCRCRRGSVLLSKGGDCYWVWPKHTTLGSYWARRNWHKEKKNKSGPSHLYISTWDMIVEVGVRQDTKGVLERKRRNESLFFKKLSPSLFFVFDLCSSWDCTWERGSWRRLQRQPEETWGRLTEKMRRRHGDCLREREIPRAPMSLCDKKKITKRKTRDRDLTPIHQWAVPKIVKGIHTREEANHQEKKKQWDWIP